MDEFAAFPRIHYVLILYPSARSLHHRVLAVADSVVQGSEPCEEPAPRMAKMDCGRVRGRNISA